jgi:hypothetical protein
VTTRTSALAAAAQHQQHPAGDLLAHRVEQRGDGSGLVRVVHHGEIALSGVHPLHPAGHLGRADALGQARRISPCGVTDGQRDQRVGDVEDPGHP